MDDQTYHYVQGLETDYLLLRWLERMRQDGDLDHTLSAQMSTPALFLQFFQSRFLFYRLNEEGDIKMACWMEPIMGAAWLSFWIHPNQRDMKREPFYWLYDMIDLAFTNTYYPATAICGMIQERRQPHITRKFIELHVKMGYTYSGKLPKFFDGKTAYFVSMTDDAWEENESALKRSWLRDRAKKSGDIEWVEPLAALA